MTHLDDRLPDLVTVTQSTRQQRRRVAAHPTPCTKCHRLLAVADLCHADGRDAHQTCADTWNATVLDAWETLKTQDAAATQEGALWTPPTATPAVPPTA